MNDWSPGWVDLVEELAEDFFQTLAGFSIQSPLARSSLELGPWEACGQRRGWEFSLTESLLWPDLEQRTLYSIP